MGRVVVVGAGLAGFRVGRSLRQAGFDGEVIIVGDEPHLPYDRPPLSKRRLAGDMTDDQCRLPGEMGDMSWRLGAAAESVDTGRRVVNTAAGVVSYDALVVASGRRARTWPGLTPADGVYTLRSLADVAALSGAITPGVHVTIIGAGFIGCEVAATLRERGTEVTIVEPSKSPMPVIGRDAGARARVLHERHGVRWRLGRSVHSIEGKPGLKTVVLDDGEVLTSAIVLVAIGSVANIEWLDGSPVDLRDGVVKVDWNCRALDERGRPVDGVWAAGDVAAWEHPHAGRHVCIEHWSNARDMADRVAASIVGSVEPSEPLRSVPSFWSDQYDVKIKSVGLLGAAEEFTVVDEDPDRSMLVVEGRRANELVGAVAFNAPKAILKYQRALRDAFS